MRSASLFSTKTNYRWSCRPYLRIPSQTRHFHPSDSHRFDPLPAIQASIDLSHTCIQSIHSITGLPWWVSLFFTGALFRFAWAPIQYFINKNAQKRRPADALLLAWRTAGRQQARQRFPDGTEKAAKGAEQWVQQKLISKKVELDKKYGKRQRVRDFTISLAFLPIWLANATAVRSMCGWQSSGEPWVPPEPLLQVGGDLWFQDLTTGDPIKVLGLCFLAGQSINWYTSGGNRIPKLEAQRDSFDRGDPRRRSLQRQILPLEVFRWLALSSGLIVTFVDIPAGLLLFINGSVWAQLAQKSLLKQLMGMNVLEPPTPRIPESKTATASFRRRAKT